MSDYESRNRILPAVSLSILIPAVYPLTRSGTFHNPHEGSAFGVVESIVRHSRLNLGQMAWGAGINPQERLR